MSKKEEYAYYLKEYKEKYHYVSIRSRGDGKSFTLQEKMRELLKEQKSDDTEIDIDDFPF